VLQTGGAPNPGAAPGERGRRHLWAAAAGLRTATLNKFRFVIPAKVGIQDFNEPDTASVGVMACSASP